MTTIKYLNISELQSHMGDEATQGDANCMMEILTRECVTDTDDVSEDLWFTWCDEAAERSSKKTGV